MPEYVDMSAYDLRLSLLTDPVDEALMHVLRAETITGKSWSVELRIIGASHWFTIKWDRFRIHEVFSCHGFQDGRSLFHMGPIGSIKGPVDLELFGVWHYQFQLKQCPLESGDAWARQIVEKVDESPSKDGQLGFIHTFPALGEGLCPQTIVLATMEEDGVKLNSIHSYPNENTQIISETLISLI